MQASAGTATGSRRLGAFVGGLSAGAILLAMAGAALIFPAAVSGMGGAVASSRAACLRVGARGMVGLVVAMLFAGLAGRRETALVRRGCRLIVAGRGMER